MTVELKARTPKGKSLVAKSQSAIATRGKSRKKAGQQEKRISVTISSPQPDPSKEVLPSRTRSGKVKPKKKEESESEEKEPVKERPNRFSKVDRKPAKSKNQSQKKAKNPKSSSSEVAFGSQSNESKHDSSSERSPF